MKFTHASLFSGIGGFDLAAEWMDWQNIFHCEWNPFCQKVLAYHFPNSIPYNDITKTNFTIHRGTIDILTGGFPCQPYSVAGKQKGTEDERHLWPEMLRAIREIQPRFVVGENVPGLVNWSNGLVFEQVQADLEAEGYEVTPFILPAAGVNAPHQRDRIWFIAYAEGKRNNGEERNFCKKDERPWPGQLSKFNLTSDRQIRTRVTSNSCCKQCTVSIQQRGQKQAGHIDFTRFNENEFASNSNKIDRRFKPQERSETERARRQSERQDKWNDADTSRTGWEKCIPTKKPINQGYGPWFPIETWRNFPTQPPVCNGDDGISDRLDAITFSSWKTKSIMAGGNAIVPQVALQIFKAIEEFKKLSYL